MPRLYRQAPLNSIWEGSGNIQCLDVLRALQREPACREAYFAELALVARRAPAAGWRSRARCRNCSKATASLEVAVALGWSNAWPWPCRRACLVRAGDVALADAFCDSRLGTRHGLAFGTLEPSPSLQEALIERVLPVE